MRPWSEVVEDLMAARAAVAGPRWHVVQVLPRYRDAQAVENLQRYYEVYYPLQRSLRPLPLRRLSRRQREVPLARLQPVTRPFLPRYSFARFDAASDWRTVFDRCGVIGLGLCGGLPAAISDDVVAAMRAAEVEGAIPGETPAIRVFRLGEPVEIVSGPFATLRGSVERIRHHVMDDLDITTKLVVLIGLLGRLTPVEVDARQVASKRGCNGP